MQATSALHSDMQFVPSVLSVVISAQRTESPKTDSVKQSAMSKVAAAILAASINRTWQGNLPCSKTTNMYRCQALELFLNLQVFRMGWCWHKSRFHSAPYLDLDIQMHYHPDTTPRRSARGAAAATVLSYLLHFLVEARNVILPSFRLRAQRIQPQRITAAHEVDHVKVTHVSGAICVKEFRSRGFPFQGIGTMELANRSSEHLRWSCLVISASWAWARARSAGPAAWVSTAETQRSKQTN